MKIIIIGGSIGGLSAGIALRANGLQYWAMPPSPLDRTLHLEQQKPTAMPLRWQTAYSIIKM